MKTINYDKLKEIILTFSKDRDWNQFHSIKNLSMALSVEASELIEIFQWMSEADSNNIKNDPQKYPQVKAEIADIFIYLIQIASRLDIDLEEAVLTKMKANELKYPVELARGNSKKYDEY